MSYYEILVAGVILLIASIVEQYKLNINPLIWILGGGSGIVLKYVYKPEISWIEGVCTVFAVFSIILIFSKKLVNVIGGGILKGIMMCSIYLGRWTIVFIPLIIILLFLEFKRLEKKKATNSLVLGMPYLMLSYLVSVGVLIYFM